RQQAVSPSGGFASTVQDDAVGETGAELVAEVGEVAEVARVDVDGGLDLDTGNPAVGSLDNDIDFTIVGISVVAEPHLLLGPGRLLDQFHEDEGFQELPYDRRGRIEQAVRGHAEQRGGQACVGHV